MGSYLNVSPQHQSRQLHQRRRLIGRERCFRSQQRTFRRVAYVRRLATIFEDFEVEMQGMSDDDFVGEDFHDLFASHLEGDRFPHVRGKNPRPFGAIVGDFVVRFNVLIIDDVAVVVDDAATCESVAFQRAHADHLAIERYHVGWTRVDGEGIEVFNIFHVRFTFWRFRLDHISVVFVPCCCCRYFCCCGCFSILLTFDEAHVPDCSLHLVGA